ncbi:MAG TPA: hypothetical protein VFS79_00895, partial [Arthrobacter sp.]|nr:hypothetical protein [Arthrobacter sp.]
IQPITKTIGINKLGTLLSSQTTDTPGTTTHSNKPWIAPEQLFKLTRFQPALQIGVSAILVTVKPAPPAFGAPEGEPFSGCLVRGLAAIFPLQRRRLRKQYTG